MAHNEPLLITQPEKEDGGGTVHEMTPLLTLDDKEAKQKQSMVSRLKNRVFVNSKAANMILVWNFLVSLLYGLSLDPASIVSTELPYLALAFNLIVSPCMYGFVAVCLLFYPLAGYLADVHFGRYKTVRCSLWTIWIALLSIVVGCAIIVIPITLCTDLMSTPWLWVIVACSIFAGLIFLIAFIAGLAGFRANVIQFGMDQLQDSPARDSSLFIFWFLATLYTGIGLGKVAWSSLFIYNSFILIVAVCITVLMFLIVMPISLCVGHCKRRWFILTPGIGNPYRQVRKVVSFARKHKIPVQRSAFTYWEEDIPSGLDLGKDKYGGPFTTEQVEDVKAFFGILKILLSLGPFFTADIAASDFLSKLGGHMRADVLYSDPWFVFTNGGVLYPWLIVLMILLYILTPQRYTQNYTPGMLKRIGIGLCLITVSLICSLTMDTAGHIRNPNATCIFIMYGDGSDNSLDFSPTLLLIQNILTAVAYILIYGGTFEFICAQSPHSLKGFLIGISFAIKGLFQLLGVLGVILPFTLVSFYHPVFFLSCGFSYYIVNIVISIIGVIAFTYTAKKYKYRQRDEFCDERRYIEEFYENAVNHNPPPDVNDLTI